MLSLKTKIFLFTYLFLRCTQCLKYCRTYDVAMHVRGSSVYSFKVFVSYTFLILHRVLGFISNMYPIFIAQETTMLKIGARKILFKCL